MSETKTYAAWLVDFDGTLYRPTPLKILMAFELAVGGIGAIAVVREFRRQHEALRDSASELQELREQWPSPYDQQLQLTSRALGYPVERVRAVVEEWMRERPQKWLRYLARRGLVREIQRYAAGGGRLGLVSDYPVADKLSALACGVQFDVVVAHGEERCPTHLKPHPSGYLAAARALGVEPQACLVIGDREDADGEAARRAGMGFRLIA